jgi:hypothetical protein
MAGSLGSDIPHSDVVGWPYGYPTLAAAFPAPIDLSKEKVGKWNNATIQLHCLIFVLASILCSACPKKGDGFIHSIPAAWAFDAVATLSSQLRQQQQGTATTKRQQTGSLSKLCSSIWRIDQRRNYHCEWFTDCFFNSWRWLIGGDGGSFSILFGGMDISTC